MKPKRITRFRTLKATIIFDRKEDKVKPTSKIPNTRQADGTGVPSPPRLRYNADGSPDFSHLGQGEPTQDDLIEVVKHHLIKKLGHQAAMKRLKVMSGMELVALADKLKREANENTTKIARKEGDYEEYSAPKMRW
jgi:hypothetical protein